MTVPQQPPPHDGATLPGLYPGEEARYWAFISYSHKDESWARWLHTGLETYGIPRKLWDRPSSVGPVPKRMFPVFRDREELPGAADLGAKLKTALRVSRTLVVICSPRSAASVWVNEEVREFKALGRGHRVLCLIVDGEPNATDMAGRAAEECFPPAIRFRVADDGTLTGDHAEPIAADARPGKDGRALALLKVISGLLEVGFDELRQRDLQRQRWRQITRASVAVSTLLLAGALYVGLADAGLKLPRSEQIRRTLDRRQLSVFRPVRPLAEIQRAASGLRQRLSTALLGARRPDGWLNCTVRQGGLRCREVWSHSQSLYGVLLSPDPPDGGKIKPIALLDRPFDSDQIITANGRQYGWISHEGDVDVLAEPALWLTAALSAAHRAAAADPGADAALKARILQQLELTQKMLGAGHLAEGPAAGWNMFPDQVQPERHNCYTTALALLALMELKRAGLPWGGSTARRDELLVGAARWLIEQYHDNVAVPGWRIYGKKDPAVSDVFDGLTLQIYSLLMQAEEEAGVTLPPGMVAAIAPHLERTLVREITFPVGSGEFFLRYKGPERITPGKEQIGFLWYPWAVRAASWWLRRNARVGGAPEERVGVQRALGHLILTIGPAAVDKAVSDWAFIPAETLIGLSSVARVR